MSDARAPSIAPSPAVPVAGLVLRYALVVALHDHGAPLTVGQLGAALDRQGLVVSGRTSKVVSDALRWEVDRGRVRRVARGTYAFGRVARQTIWRMRRRIAAHRSPALSAGPAGPPRTSPTSDDDGR